MLLESLGRSSTRLQVGYADGQNTHQDMKKHVGGIMVSITGLVEYIKVERSRNTSKEKHLNSF